LPLFLLLMLQQLLWLLLRLPLPPLLLSYQHHGHSLGMGETHPPQLLLVLLLQAYPPQSLLLPHKHKPRGRLPSRLHCRLHFW
jgi:hypothetical protein